MPELKFFTPVIYTKPTESSFLENVDNYFYLGGKKALVIQEYPKSKQVDVILSESKPSLLERIGKALSYFIIIIPILMFSIKVVLRSRHNFKIIDPKEELEQGLEISRDTTTKIQQLIPKVLRKEEDHEIRWLSKENNLVFKLNDDFDIVYKITPTDNFVVKNNVLFNSHEITHERFENMIMAKTVCLINKLNLLIIPHAKKLSINAEGTTHTLIAEESLDIDLSENAHEELYHRHSTQLNETARQLAVFVAKTGFNDVSWRNIPLLNEPQGFQGNRRVALIDLEHMENAEHGFLGSFNGSRGLIRCMPEAQIDLVIKEARTQGVAITHERAQRAKKQRLLELEHNKQATTKEQA